MDAVLPGVGWAVCSGAGLAPGASWFWFSSALTQERSSSRPGGLTIKLGLHTQARGWAQPEVPGELRCGLRSGQQPRWASLWLASPPPRKVLATLGCSVVPCVCTSHLGTSMLPAPRGVEEGTLSWLAYPPPGRGGRAARAEGRRGGLCPAGLHLTCGACGHRCRSEATCPQGVAGQDQQGRARCPSCSGAASPNGSWVGTSERPQPSLQCGFPGGGASSLPHCKIGETDPQRACSGPSRHDPGGS